MRLGDKQIQRVFLSDRCRPNHPAYERLRKCRFTRFGRGESHGTQGVFAGAKVGGGAVGIGRARGHSGRGGGPCCGSRTSLQDDHTAVAGPFDHATARLQLVDHPSGTTAVLHVRGVDPAVADRTFGAHLHNGPCATDAPTVALGHYNADAHAGHVPVVVSSQTEVWLDFTVDATGAGDSQRRCALPPSSQRGEVCCLGRWPEPSRVLGPGRSSTVAGVRVEWCVMLRAWAVVVLVGLGVGRHVRTSMRLAASAGV